MQIVNPAICGIFSQTAGETSEGREAVRLRQRIYAAQSERVLRRAWRSAVGMGHSYVGSEHLLLALCGSTDTMAGRLLHWAGLRPETLRERIIRRSGAGDRRARLRRAGARM